MSHPLAVLIVEDSEDDALLVVRSLQKGGFQPQWERVQTAEELKNALKGDRAWDVIISDYRLPGFDAPAALEIVNASQRDIPFLVVSGTIGDAAAVELMRMGAHDYLMKENLTRLPEVVRRELRDVQTRIEQQQTTLELDRTKDRLQLAIEGSGIGTWDWNVQTGMVSVNERCAQILGYELTDILAHRIETWQQYIHPDDIAHKQALLESHFRGEIDTYDCEFRLCHRLGHWVWVLDRGKVVERDRTGRPLRMTGTYLDISDRKQAERRLELQNSILERIAKAEPLVDILDAMVRAIEGQLDGALASILLCDMNGNLYHGAAPHLPDAYLQSIGELPIREGNGSCGTAAFRREIVIAPDIATDPLWRDYKDFALSNGLRACWSIPVMSGRGEALATFAIYYRDRHEPNADEIAVLALAANIAKIAIEREQSAQALAKVNRDLEGRVVQRTVALQTSEAKLQSILSFSPAVIYVKDLEGRYSLVNAAFLSIFECTIADIIGKTDHDFFPPDVADCLVQNDQLVLSTGQFQQYEETIRWGDMTYTFLSNKFLLLDLDGHPYALCGISTDICDRKQVEEQLHQTNAELARATRLKDEFLANMSHELRTPLNAILGMSEGLQEQIFGALNERQKTAIATIEKSGRHLLELINDILDLSKIEAGKLELDLNDVPIHSLCHTCLSFVKQFAFSKQITIQSEIPESLSQLSIQIDDRRMRQVLINLLSNAVKFTPPGGHVWLRVQRQEASHLTVDSSINPANLQSHICFAIADTGIGIAPEHMGRLFQSFVQIDSSLNRQYTGTGLGLALVKRITEMHGGSVSVVSKLGEGSCFTVCLPIQNTPQEHFQTHTEDGLNAPETGNRALITKAPRILLVEDNEANIMTISSYLTAKQYNVLLARSGEEAIAMTQTEEMDLILMDIQMPGMDGLTAIQAIRKNPALMGVPIIALTALAMTGDRERCLEAGANDYLPKPIKLRQLTILIEQLLSAK
jgi:PAS domain S-box-containing protein